MLSRNAAPRSRVHKANTAHVGAVRPYVAKHATPVVRCVTARSASKDVLEADVVIVGAGIVGLFTAQELLRNQMSVLLLERKGLCAGATGAGQGYLWMAHRSPGSVGWALAARSVALWRRQVAADEGLRAAVEWQECGSVLVATSPEESAALSERQLALNAVGLSASFADAARLATLEPGLVPPRGGAGLLVTSDLQINGRAAAHALLERCRGSSARGGPSFRDLMGPEAEVTGLELEAAPGGGHVVRTPGRRVHARHALVLSAGVWTGTLLSAATGQPSWSVLLQPRRGHLLELPPTPGMPRVVHGMMEMSYTKHYATATTGISRTSAGKPATPSASPSPSPSAAPEPADITFTATTSASGSLLIGSSRECQVWDSSPSPAIVAAILQRAAIFLPALKHAAEAAAEAADGGICGGGGPLGGLSVRVGLRPYAMGGLPLVGPLEGAPGLFVAAGHEGSGLCMGPATGELLVRHIRKHAGELIAGGGSGGAGLDTRSFEELLPDARRRAAAAVTT